ncbi:MAG: ATP-dependent helicase [Fusobacteriaceae bacterium]|nr:ATP-dependent helicase [Fusobacteriaceae bacterium]
MRKLSEIVSFFIPKKSKKIKESEKNNGSSTARGRRDDKSIAIRRAIGELEKREVRSYDRELLCGRRIDYERLLNAEQKRALTALSGKYLVIAGAGSGKTRTVVYRTALLLETGVDPGSILMITFTRKAAAEMRERLAELCGSACGDVAISTFHAFCLRHIMTYKSWFGYENLQIFEDKGVEDLLTKLAAVHHVKRVRGLPFPQARRLRELFSREALKGIPLEEQLTERERPYADEILAVRRAFGAWKKEKGCLEFDDLLRVFTEGLARNHKFRELIRERYRHVVVDEYQDSNADQRKLLRELVGESGNLMVVGDDWQSIYGFRGADFTNILRFSEDFPDARLIRLATNYRSTDEIISFCNRIAARFALGYRKVIRGTGKTHKKPQILSFATKEQEAAYITEKIRELKAQGVSPGEIAILYRNRYAALHIRKALKEAGLPFAVREAGEDASLPDKAETAEKPVGETRERVALFTVHSSKGLEWDYVFLPVLLDGVFPASRDAEGLEEEKRLYYVACSRARKMLWLTRPDYFYEKTGFFDKPSRFLDYGGFRGHDGS